MSSAYFVRSHDTAGEPVQEIFYGDQLGAAIVAFIKATEECESAELVWSS